MSAATAREQPRFVLDVHLGRLATFLRMFGFDAVYCRDSSDSELRNLALREERILLSRDRELLNHEHLKRKYLVKSNKPRIQLMEVIDEFCLYDQARPLERCLVCNLLLVPVKKEDVKGRIPPAVHGSIDEYSLCNSCKRVYWAGSHYERMKSFVGQVLLSQSSGKCH